MVVYGIRWVEYNDYVEDQLNDIYVYEYSNYIYLNQIYQHYYSYCLFSLPHKYIYHNIFL